MTQKTKIPVEKRDICCDIASSLSPLNVLYAVCLDITLIDVVID